ncbi:MAG: aldehyde dehydrogenase, partial [Alphaproteobacteria bacterium]|nr:aldehyde dehydrogenase [Alphaproteobacteria bacterium]
GASHEMASTLADHNDVDAIWAFGDADLSTMVEKKSAGNLKRCFVDYGKAYDWTNPDATEGEHFLRKATEVKNIWIPYGE